MGRFSPWLEAVSHGFVDRNGTIEDRALPIVMRTWRTISENLALMRDVAEDFGAKGLDGGASLPGV